MYDGKTTVSELIEILNKLPDDMEIMSVCTESGYLNSLCDEEIKVIEVVRDLNSNNYGGSHVDAADLKWYVDFANDYDDEKIDINECVKEKVLAIG